MSIAGPRAPKRGPSVLVTDTRETKPLPQRPTAHRQGTRIISVDNVLQYASEIPSAQRRVNPGLRPLHHTRTPSGRHPLDPKLSGRGVPLGGGRAGPGGGAANLPARTSKISEKLVLLPETTEEDDEDDEFKEDDSAPPRDDELKRRKQNAKRGGKSEAERLPKSQRQANAQLARVTAYCTAQSYKLRSTAAFVRDQHAARTKLYDDCLYCVYQLPLLGGSDGFRVRSSPVVKNPGGRSVLDEQIEANERREYREGWHEDSAEYSVPNETGRYEEVPPSDEQVADQERRRTDYAVENDTHDSRNANDEVWNDHDHEHNRSQSNGSSFSLPSPSAGVSPDAHTVAELFIFSYGVAVLWNFTPNQEKDLLADLTFSSAALAQHGPSNSKASAFSSKGALLAPPSVFPLTTRPLDESDFETEEFHFQYDNHAEKPRIYNDMITLRTSDHMIKLAMSHAIGQSTKLSFFEERMQKTMTDAQYVPRRLALEGRLGLSRAEVVSLVGRLFEGRVDVNLSSNMLDTPTFFWEAEPTLHPLYSAVREYLEIKPRIQVLNERCQVFLDLAEILSDSIADVKMTRITWIIIVLIVLSILVTCTEVFLRFAILAAGKGKEGNGAAAVLGKLGIDKEYHSEHKADYDMPRPSSGHTRGIVIWPEKYKDIRTPMSPEAARRTTMHDKMPTRTRSIKTRRQQSLAEADGPMVPKHQLQYSLFVMIFPHQPLDRARLVRLVFPSPIVSPFRFTMSLSPEPLTAVNAMTALWNEREEHGFSGAWVGSWYLGQGGQGRATLWVKQDTDGLLADRLAVKTGRCRTKSMVADPQNQSQKITSEIAVMKQLTGCDDVVQLRNYRITTPTEPRTGSSPASGTVGYRLYLDFCGNGDLSGVISMTRKARNAGGVNMVPESFVWHCFERCVTAGLKLYTGNTDGTRRPGWSQIWHRDIKPENVFLGDNNNGKFFNYPAPKIGDFGLAVMIDNPSNVYVDAHKECGTPGRRAREQMSMVYRDTEEVDAQVPRDDWRRTAPMSSKVDVWAVALTMWSLMARQDGDHGLEWEQVEEYGTGRNMPVFSSHMRSTYSSELCDLVTRCLSDDPAGRPDFIALQTEIQRILNKPIADQDDAIQDTLTLRNVDDAPDQYWRAGRVLVKRDRYIVGLAFSQVWDSLGTHPLGLTSAPSTPSQEAVDAQPGGPVGTSFNLVDPDEDDMSRLPQPLRNSISRQRSPGSDTGRNYQSVFVNNRPVTAPPATGDGSDGGPPTDESMPNASDVDRQGALLSAIGQSSDGRQSDHGGNSNGMSVDRRSEDIKPNSGDDSNGMEIDQPSDGNNHNSREDSNGMEIDYSTEAPTNDDNSKDSTYRP